VEVTYAFNETYVAVNVTVAATIPLPVTDGYVYFYNFFLDVDKNPSTGYRPWWARDELGAEYLVQAYIDSTTTQKPVARVWRYTGKGDDWSWGTEELDIYDARVSDDGKTIELYAKKEYLVLPSGDVYFAVSTQREDVLADYLVVGSGTGGPVPIPEPALLVAASTAAALLVGFIGFTVRRF